MVQILPPKYNIGDQIGQSLQRGMEQGSQVGFQRGMLQNAMKGLEDVPSGTTPFQLASRLIQATAGIPGAERYVGQLFPLLMNQLQGQTAQGTPPPPGGMNQQQQPSSAGRQVPIQSVTDPSQYLQRVQQETGLQLPPPDYTPDLFKGTLDPTSLGMGPIPPQYSPEEVQRVRLEDRAIYGENSPRANEMEKYNDLSRARTSDIVKAAEIQSGISERAANRQQTRRNTLQEHLGIKDPSDLAVAETISERPEFRNIANDKIWAERVSKEFNQYQSAKAEFEKGSARPNPIINPIGYKTALENMGSKAQKMIDYGQRDKVYNQLAQNGWSESEIAKELNPLPESVKSNLSKVVNSPKSWQGQVSGDMKKSVDSLYNFFEKNVKPGSYDPKKPDVFKPGPSLVLMRNALLKKGFFYNEIDNAISSLVKNGSISLDPDQTREFQMMSQSPERTSSLYEIIFGYE